MRRLRLRVVVGTGIAGAAVCAALLAAQASARPARHHALTGTISVVYSETYEFDSKDLADSWWGRIKTEFEKKYPGAHLKLEPVQGTDFDEQKKIALLLRSASTSPDVMSIETTTVGELEQSGYLLPLNTYVNAEHTFWPYFAKPIKDMSTMGGQVYAVNSGNNVSQLFYNKAMLQKAGVKLPWRPKTWNDVIAVARKVKAANSGVIPFWLHAGVTTGPYVTVVQTLANLIFGSKNPVMLDPKTGKWVVDSPGLRASLGFYKSIFSGGLAESVGQAFNPQAAILVPDFMRKHKVAIVLGSNWYPGSWVFKFATPWPTAEKEVAVAPIPTQAGQAPGTATSLAGWCFSIAKVSKNPELAFGLIKIMEESKNSIDHANWAGFVPPSTKDASSPAFAKFAPPQGEFRNYASFATPVPSDPGYPVYARALSQATGTFAQNPSTSVADAIKSITQTVQQQLGKGKTEVLP